MREKLAAALLQLLDEDFHPLIDREWAKGKTADEIIARFECDHYPISVKLGGNNHPTNLQWLTKEEHAEKTQTFDRIRHNKIRKIERSAKEEAKRAKRREAYERKKAWAKQMKEKRDE